MNYIMTCSFNPSVIALYSKELKYYFRSVLYIIKFDLRHRATQVIFVPQVK